MNQNTQSTHSFFCLNSTGSRYLLMNQHMLLHLKKNVSDHGPLWCSSLFIFEDWNGDISNYFHGTQNIANQVNTLHLYICIQIDIVAYKGAYGSNREMEGSKLSKPMGQNCGPASC